MHRKPARSKFPVRAKPIHAKPVPGEVDPRFEQVLKQSGVWSEYKKAEKGR